MSTVHFAAFASFAPLRETFLCNLWMTFAPLRRCGRYSSASASLEPQMALPELAAAIHVALTTAIFLIGHFRVLPNTFNENGIGITFAIDGKTYHQVAVDLVTQWKTNGFIAWLKTKAPLHSRLHSLSFMIFGWLLGYNILSAEPLNLFYFLAILSCIYFPGPRALRKTNWTTGSSDCWRLADVFASFNPTHPRSAFNSMLARANACVDDGAEP